MFYPFAYPTKSEDSEFKRVLSREEMERMPPYKPTIEVVETKTYNIEGTWAHTRPSERIIVILPVEFRDYNLPVFAHEVIHNLHPENSESWVHGAAYNKTLADAAIRSFDFTYKKA